MIAAHFLFRQVAQRNLLLVLLLLSGMSTFGYTRQDTLRGSNGRGRDWWDVLKYNVQINFDTTTKEISGRTIMTFKVISTPSDSMQIDLQEGMELKGAIPYFNGDWDTPSDNFVREGNVYWLKRTNPLWPKKVGESYRLTLLFKGKPRTAINPPWDGGLIWTKDSLGNPSISVACQGLGASAWWPCKDYQGDEPDFGATLLIENYPSGLGIISNGKGTLVDSLVTENPFTGEIRERHLLTNPISAGADVWQVINPINTYDVTFYIGDYAHWHDTLQGEKGILDLDFYPLRYNEAKARKQWAQAKEMLHCFEYWMGPYPFYEDGYKLVEAPYLGMEHQSAIAYGNGYKNGYRRPDGHMIDRSGTGVGFAFDFIIIHESGHEWFGNSITAQDVADNWLHEGFTTYTETLFAEWIKGKDSAFAYAQGEWKNIKNDRPIIGDYGVNNEGSSDMYDKGAAVVHMIRLMLNDDEKFRQLLRGLNRDFYHKIVTSKEVEEYISRFVGRDLSAFFDVYLRSTVKPVLEWSTDGGSMKWHWKNVQEKFSAPFMLNVDNKGQTVDVDSSSGMVHFDDFVENINVTACDWYDVVQKK